MMGHAIADDSHIEHADGTSQLPDNEQAIPRITTGEYASQDMNFAAWMAFIV